MLIGPSQKTGTFPSDIRAKPRYAQNRKFSMDTTPSAVVRSTSMTPGSPANRNISVVVHRINVSALGVFTISDHPMVIAKRMANPMLPHAPSPKPVANTAAATSRKTVNPKLLSAL